MPQKSMVIKFRTQNSLKISLKKMYLIPRHLTLPRRMSSYLLWPEELNALDRLPLPSLQGTEAGLI